MSHDVFDERWYLTPHAEEGDPDLHTPEELDELRSDAGLSLSGSSSDFFEEAGGRLASDVPELLVSNFVHEVFRIPNKEGRFDKFSFEGRRHLPPVYDTPARKILLCTARQVEKCVHVDTLISTREGLKRAGDIRVGEVVASKNLATGELEWKRVTWVSERLSKPAVKVHAVGQLPLVCGLEHPIRTWGGWTKAGELKRRDQVEFAQALPVVEQGEAHILQATVSCLVILHGRLKGMAKHLLLRKDGLGRELLMGLVREVFPAEAWGGQDGGPGHINSDLENKIDRWVLRLKDRGYQPLKDLDQRTLELLFRLMWLVAGGILQGSGRIYSGYLTPRLSEVATILELGRRVGVALRYETRRNGVQTNYYVVPYEFSVERVRELVPERVPPRGERSPRDFKKGPGDRLPYQVYVELRERWLLEGGKRLFMKMGGFVPKGGVERSWVTELLGRMELEGVPAYRLEGVRREVASRTFWKPIDKVVRLRDEQPMVDFTVEDNENFFANGYLVHNSTYLGNRILSYCVSYPGYKALYVSPSNIQTQTFSKDRLRNPIQTSPFLQNFVKGGTMNVQDITFGNASNVVLRSAYLSADRCRGIAAYKLCIDEFQDILPEHIPVIMPCISHSPENLKYVLFTGTPKSFDNNMEFYRSGYNAEKPMSTMGEWMVPCDSCGNKSSYRFWQCLAEVNIQKKGLSCSRCGALLFPQHPDAFWHHQQADGEFESYRIPQLMVPWRDWGEIYSDYINYPRARFYNEVLGLSMDDHSRPLSLTEIRECCDSRIDMSKVGVFKPGKWHEMIFAGIDWGGGTSSYTVLTLGTYIGGIFTIIYCKRYTGQLLDVQEQILYTLSLLKEFRVEIAGTDFGYGLQYNDHLIRRYGRDKIAVYQHVGRITQKVGYDRKVGRWKLFRSMVMADFINMVKRKNIRFPRWEDFREPFAQDFCNITSEYNETQNIVQYTHRGDRPDDSFHSALYCFLASTIRIPRPDVFAPLHDRYQQGPVRTLLTDYDQG